MDYRTDLFLINFSKISNSSSTIRSTKARVIKDPCKYRINVNQEEKIVYFFPNNYTSLAQLVVAFENEGWSAILFFRSKIFRLSGFSISWIMYAVAVAVEEFGKHVT